MKKIVFLSLVMGLFCLHAVPSFAAGCGGASVHLAGNQSVTDNEFLYTNHDAFQEMLNKINTHDGSTISKLRNDGYIMSKGQMLECDNSICENYAFAYVASEKPSWKGNQIEKGTIFQCFTTVHDRWETVTSVENCPTDGPNSRLRRPYYFYYATDGGVRDIAKDKNLEYFVITYNGKLCRCAGDYEYDDINKKCVKKGGDVNPNPPAPTPDPDDKDCPEGYEHPTADDAEIEISSPCENCSKLSVKECYSKKMLMCYRAMKTNPKTVWWNNYDTCFCKTNKGLVGEWQDGRCVTSQNTNLCAQLKNRGATDERVRCCLAGVATEWHDANGVIAPNSLGKEAGEKCICKDTTKTWNSAKGICEGQNVIGGNCDKYLGDVDAYKCCSGQSNGVSYWDEVNKKCHCLKTGEEWDYNQHMCLKENSTGDEKECRYKFHGEFKCSNGTRIRRDYEFILSKEDLKNMTCEKFQERYRNDARGIESLFQKLCLDSQNTEQIPLDAATKKAISNINSFFDMSESNRNVWRDEEGQFNTARLASDATAGVVLGTVGGIVSAKVIKKKQLEKGFDVLHCTVGGQKMADYGDTFQVSYQR